MINKTTLHLQQMCVTTKGVEAAVRYPTFLTSELVKTKKQK